VQRNEIIAALGPTNTGKTYRALQRMKEHETGIIGLPLRLLAREVYDGLCSDVGREQVALITGEEKIVPLRARYYVCTVEAMPMEREVDFVAVDEVQLASHHERGHVFTDRILRARGRLETWFIGSQSMAPFLTRLVPTAYHREFPRLSRLRCEGRYTLGSLPRRSAVVAFSTPRVYELAERIRAKRGGAAIVLGALSPRARNAQVEMYQSGEVDYLVATDAIGMGLNLDIDRVAFADTRKFDGRQERSLDLGELAQIAGRAGRYQRDGAFGTLAPREPLPENWAKNIEEHRFFPQKSIFYRNSELDFSAPAALLRSLHQAPRLFGLEMIPDPIDTQTLQLLLAREEVLQRVVGEAELRLLFEVCQVPDYRKLLIEEHARLSSEIFLELVEHGRLRELFLSKRIERLRKHSGDIEAITGRIASVRTWRYVTTRSAWVASSQFAERTQELEDLLSDELHAALVDRFVAKRNRKPIVSSPSGSGSEFHARLAQLRQQLDPATHAPATSEVSRILEASDDSFVLDDRGSLGFEGIPLASLSRGRSSSSPQLRFTLDHLRVESGETKRLQERLRSWLQAWVAGLLGPLGEDVRPEWSSELRGIVYQLREGLGHAPSAGVLPLLSKVGEKEREQLRRWSFVEGRRFCFLKRLMKPDASRSRAILAATWTGGAIGDLGEVWKRPSAPSHAGLDPAMMEQVAFQRVGPVWIRADVLERLLDAVAGGASESMVGPICSHCGIKRAVGQKVVGPLGRLVR